MIKALLKTILQDKVEDPIGKDLDGKVVLITGGTGGVGKAIVKVLAKNGATVISFSRTGIDIERANTYNMKVDVRNKKEIDKGVESVIEKFEKIDVLINCAGVFFQKEIDYISEEEYENIMNTNVKSAFFMSAAVIPFMKHQKNGLIINIGSKISKNTSVTPGKVLYATSKYAIEGMSLSLRNELKKSGIRVTCLILGTMNTFISLRSKNFLTPDNVGFVITMLILLKDVDFESIIMKSNRQFI